MHETSKKNSLSAATITK